MQVQLVQHESVVIVATIDAKKKGSANKYKKNI